MPEDDVEFLYESGSMMCQLCSTPLHEASPQQRQAHYDVHHPLQESTSHSTTPLSTPYKTFVKGRRKSSPPRLVKDVPPARQNEFWTQTYSAPPPPSFTPGLIPTLKCALLKTHAKGQTTRAILCHEGTTHVATESWDRGWGCGYRNFLMACTAIYSQTLQPLYFPLLEEPTPPGVRNLQFWIEDAWANGFDREGAEQLKHKLVRTKKWIGTAELYVAFVSRGIPVQLVDFPGSKRGPQAVTEWVMNYFSQPVPNKGQTNAFNVLKGASPVFCAERMPVILQHSGHSRTVVGIELDKSGNTNLLVFDPSIRPSPSFRRAALAKHHALRSPLTNKNRPLSVLRPVLHSSSKSHGESSKRRLFDLPHKDSRETKRARVESLSPTQQEDAVIFVDDSDGKPDSVHSGAEGLDPLQVVKHFRISPGKLGKNDKYQILWFPLDPPLEEAERWERRVVTSERVE